MKDAKINIKQKHIAIVSTCLDSWGGSEELWALCVPYLQSVGFFITVLKKNVNYSNNRIGELININVNFIELNDNYSGVLRRVINAYHDLFNPMFENDFSVFEKFLKKQKPSLVIVSQGINFDGLYYGYLCSKHNIDFVIVSQKAVEFYWPPKEDRKFMIETFKNAKKCYFVSEHNKNLTEEQFGFRFKNAEIVYNPNKLKIEPLKYPSTEFGFKIALIGRLFIIDKGHDILFRIMAKEKWKKRNLKLSLIGSGPDSEGLAAMANLLNIENVEFLGFQNDIKQIWLDHHALVLPSRSEGMPLVVIEAMAAGRTVIATRAGGTDELVEDEITGFIGDATETSFEETLEKAWNGRQRWDVMGLEASKFIKKKLPVNPEIQFSNKITSLINE
jgi:glycosyltransferase involved in cell wall biosynthesis